MAKNNRDAAQIETGRSLMRGSSGRWAGEQLLRALQEGRPISPAELRSAATLRKDEWKTIDDALIEEGVMRLRGIADLRASGLTIPIPNALGKTLFEFEKMTDLNDALVSLSGVDRTENEMPDFSLDSIPLPITHKDWELNLRTLTASRERGESLDTTQARVAGRKVAEMLEYMLFNGGRTFGGKTIYGYLTHGDRNTVDFTDNYAWDHASKTGATIVADVTAMLKAAAVDKFYGPFNLYIPATYEHVIDQDYKATSDITIRERILKLSEIRQITVCDQLADGNVVAVQMTRDVVALLDGEPLQSVQWDVEGGFIVKFKAFAIQVPLIRSTYSGASGIVHLYNK